MNFSDIYHKLLITSNVLESQWAWILIGTLLILFFIQLYYYLGIYGGLPRFRNNRGISPDTVPPPVSIVVVVRENAYYFIENTLPLLLTQQYHQFEVVVVDCSYDDEISLQLNEMDMQYPHLKLTRINPQPNYEHSNKLALTVGIKAATYEHLLFTTIDCYPTSQRWLSIMAKGFICGDVVIGYCNLEIKKGFANRFIRCNRLATSIRYLAAAIRGHAYRGIRHNIGFTKSLYFSHRGYNYLNMNIGEDDLFIQSIVTRRNVSVIMNPHATIRETQYGGLRWWRSIRKIQTYAFRYYPLQIRFQTAFELWTRALLFIVAIVALVVLPLWWKLLPALVLLLRLLIVEIKIWSIGRRLGERKMAGTYILYDLVAPLSELCLALSRRLRPNKAIWR